MINVQCEKLNTLSEMISISEWLEVEMPNPPLPEKQRWTIGYTMYTQDNTYKVGVTFMNDHDATLFSLRWS